MNISGVMSFLILMIYT